MQTTTTIDIDRPAAEVFAYLADFENNPKWQGGMDRCRWTSEPPVGVGSTYEQVAHFLGKAILTTFEVTALDPGRSIRIESVVSTFPIQATREVEPLGDDRCRVTARISGAPPWYLRLVPFMGSMMERSVRGDYARLKSLLEAR